MNAVAEAARIASGKAKTSGNQTDVDTVVFGLLWYATLQGIPHQAHLVKNLILAGSLFVVFGESNSGKTFWLLDLCLAIAAGIPWRGRQTLRGLVIYVAGEGAASVKARTAAYRLAHPEIP